MYLQNYCHTDLDDLLRELIHPGGMANIGCWKVEVDHSENAIEEICTLISLKYKRYTDQNLGWGNVVVDIIGGSRNEEITMGELHALLEHVTQLSDTKNVTWFGRTRMYEEEDAGCSMDAPIVVSLLFEKIIKDDQEACFNCIHQTQKPDGRIEVYWMTVNEKNHNKCGDKWEYNSREIKVGETFTLDEKEVSPFSGDVDNYGISVPKYPFTFKLLDNAVEWSVDPYDGDGVVAVNGKVDSFEIFPVMNLSKGVYKYEQDCLTQIK